MPASPAERVLHARIAAAARWSRENGDEQGRKMRDAFDARFEREVDPDLTLSPEERARRVRQARSAYFARLALKSAQARRRKRERAA